MSASVAFGAVAVRGFIQSGIPQTGRLDIVRPAHVLDVRRVRDLRDHGHYQFLTVDVLLKDGFGKAKGEFRKVMSNWR